VHVVTAGGRSAIADVSETGKARRMPLRLLLRVAHDMLRKLLLPRVGAGRIEGVYLVRCGRAEVPGDVLRVLFGMTDVLRRQGLMAADHDRDLRGFGAVVPKTVRPTYRIEA